MTSEIDEVAGEHTLPSGGTVRLRDPRGLRVRDRRAVALNVTDLSRPMARRLDVIDGLAGVLLETRSLPYLPPNALQPRDIQVDRDRPGWAQALVGDFSIADYDRLSAIVEPVAELLWPGEPTPDGAGVPGSPTEPASD